MIYKGEFKDMKKHGKGKFLDNSKHCVFKGHWEND